MHYRAKEKIAQKLDCSLLVVCSEHLVICQDKSLQSMFFTGEKENEWNFESPIRYIKNVGGPAGKEGLLLGLKNGQVWEVHLDNVHPLLKVSRYIVLSLPFLIENRGSVSRQLDILGERLKIIFAIFLCLFQTYFLMIFCYQQVTANEGIRCLDISQRKQKLAVVDESGLCQVFNTKTGELFFQEANANSVAFNTLYEDMLSFSGNNNLSIKVNIKKYVSTFFFE